MVNMKSCLLRFTGTGMIRQARVYLSVLLSQQRCLRDGGRVGLHITKQPPSCPANRARVFCTAGPTTKPRHLAGESPSDMCKKPVLHPASEHVLGVLPVSGSPPSSSISCSWSITSKCLKVLPFESIILIPKEQSCDIMQERVVIRANVKAVVPLILVLRLLLYCSLPSVIHPQSCG